MQIWIDGQSEVTEPHFPVRPSPTRSASLAPTSFFWRIPPLLPSLSSFDSSDFLGGEDLGRLCNRSDAESFYFSTFFLVMMQGEN